MTYRERVLPLVLWAGGLAVVGALGLTAVLRRRSESRDLVASQMREIASPAATARSEPADQRWAGLDQRLRSRVETLTRTGSRLSAINLLRDKAGFSLTEAKTIVDGLSLGQHLSPLPEARQIPEPQVPEAYRTPAVAAPEPERAAAPRRRARQFPPGFDIDPARPAERGPHPRRPSTDAARAQRLLDQALALAYTGRVDEAAQLLHDHAAMTLPEARAAIEQLRAPED